jgi:hypothetical protein
MGAQSPSALNWTGADAAEVSPPPPYFAATTDIMPTNVNNSFSDWDFQAHYTNYTAWKPDPDGGVNITCIAYNSTYNLSYTFAGTSPSVVIEQLVLHQRAHELPGKDPGPPSEPGTVTLNMGTTNYRALFDSIYDAYGKGSVEADAGPAFQILGEPVQPGSFNYMPASLQIGQAPLVNAAATDLAFGNLIWIPGAEIPLFFESLMQNVTLSILAGYPTQTSSTTCLVTSSEPQFVYNPRRLWLIYGLGLVVALLCDFIGLIALFLNRVVGATGNDFSDFLTATRNPELNALNLKEEGIRLQYGPIASEGGRYAFGIPGSLGYSGKEVETPLLEQSL